MRAEDLVKISSGVKRYIITAVFAVIGVIGVGNFFVVNSQHGDCSANSVIECGVDNIGELRDDYNSDQTPGTRNIFSYFGIDSNMVNSAKVVNGSVTKSGNVMVGGKVVATNALTAGRSYMPNSKEQNVNGTTFYTRSPSVSFLSAELDAYIFLKSDGTFAGAVIKDCGNPVSGTNKIDPPKPPEPPKPDPEYSCDSLTASPISKLQYRFRTDETSENGAEVSKYVYDFGDGKTATGEKSSVTHTYDKPGNYTASVTVYFIVNGKEVSDTGKECTTEVSIKKEDKKSVVCSSLKRLTISEKVLNFSAAAATEGDVQIHGFVFEIENEDGSVSETRSVKSVGPTAQSGEITLKPGTYTAKATVKSSLDDVTSENCQLQFTIKKKDEPKPPTPKNPSVKIEKTVNGVESAEVEVGVPFSYEITVTNNGDVNLEDVYVSDEQPEGVTFESVEDSLGEIKDGVWSYTIPMLNKGETKTFVINAMVTEYVEESIPNTACVDAPAVNPDKQGQSDDCDDATVTLTPPEEEEVPEEDEEVTELPQTGLGDTISGIAGLGSLSAAVYYYVSTRRQLS